MNELLNSKRFWVTVASTVITAAMILSGYAVAESLAVGGIMQSYVASQGLTDFGKSKAKIESDLSEGEIEVGQ